MANSGAASGVTPPQQTGDTEQQDIDSLRALLLGADYQALMEFKSCLGDPERYGRHISAVVSEAIAHRNTLDDTVATTLAPTVERSLCESVRTNPEPIAEALYPVMGPAIRRSITETMNQALENFNSALEQSFSLRAMKWRLDALRSGRTYAEIAMLQTLDYQVEQVFLIHRETSLLLQYAVDENIEANDADMVSSMLSAIQGFVADSFAVDRKDSLNTVRLGDLTVCVETGPKAILAVVVRGSVPETLRTLLSSSLEQIHTSHRSALVGFEGDASTFDSTAPVLDGCLIGQQKQPPAKKKPWPALLVILLALAALGYWNWLRYQENKTWNSALDNLNSEPGFVVIDAQKKDEGYVVSGLREPAARKPEQVVSSATAEKLDIQWDLHPYYSLEPEFVNPRLTSLIEFPEGVDYKISGSSLTLSGTTKRNWFDVHSAIALSVVGIDDIDIAELEIIEPEPPVVAALPAVQIVEIKPDPAPWIRAIESAVFHFDTGSNQPTVDSLTQLAELIQQINRLGYHAADNDKSLQLVFEGYSDLVGTAQFNLRISQQRAENVAALINRHSALVIDSVSIGKGSIFAESVGNDNARRVIIRVVMEDLAPTEKRP